MPGIGRRFVPPLTPRHGVIKGGRGQAMVEFAMVVGLFLLCLSVYFTALVIKLFMELRVSEAVPAALVEKLENAIKKRRRCKWLNKQLRARPAPRVPAMANMCSISAR